MISLIKTDLKRYYKYIVSYLVVIYGGLFAIWKLESLYQYDLNKFLVYALTFILVACVIILVATTLFNLFYFSTSPSLYENKKVNIYYRVLGYNGYVIFIIINFLICSVLYFDFDIMSLFRLPLHIYLSLLFIIVPVNNLLICIYLKLTMNKFIKNQMHIAMLISTFILIFISGYGYYYSYFQYAGYGLILSLIPLMVTFSLNLKSKVFDFIMLLLILVLMPLNLIKGENKVEENISVETSETVVKNDYSEKNVNTVFGAMKLYQSNNLEEKIYVNDSFKIHYYNTKSIDFEITNENPLLITTLSMYKEGQEYVYYVNENSKLSATKFQNCSGNYSYDSLMKSSCVSSKLKNVVKVVVKNDYQILK